MKHVTAFLASVFMFWAVFFLSGIALYFVVPRSWWQIEVQIGSFNANLPSMIAFILGGITATYTFKASLHAKTGKLYRSKKADSP